MMPWRRRSGGALATAFLVLILAVMAGVAGAASRRPPGSASQLVKAAIAAAKHQGSVRVTVHFVTGNVTGEVVEDSARQSGVQTVAIGKERISIILLNGTAYVTGNSQGLISYFGFPASIASTMAGRWISITPSEPGYQSVIAGLTLSSALTEVSPTGTLSEGKRSTVDNQSTWSVLGTGSAHQPPTTLFVATSGRGLPVGAVTARHGGTTLTGQIVTFSRWGETVHIPQPTSPVSISTLSSGSTNAG